MCKTLRTLAFASTFFTGALAAQAQFVQYNVYSTDFGAAGTAATDGFTYAQAELTQGESKTAGVNSGTGQNAWLTNDPDNNSANAVSGAFIGGSDYVGAINGFTGFAAYVGGAQRSTTAANDVVPGAATTYLYRTVPATATTNLAFNVDFDISSSTGSFATKDSFAFILRNTAGAQLLSINFATSSNVGGTSTTATPGRLGAGYSVGGTGVGNGLANLNPTNNGIILDAKYHLSISVNVLANTFSASLSNGTIIATNVSLTGAPIAATGVTQVAAAWALTNTTPDANGAYTGAGNNILAFDNYAITVPEPSTYAAMGLGVLVLVWLGKLRRRA